MTRPSWGDFGTYDESAHPELWDGVVGAWCPSLGPTGTRLHDHSRGVNWGTLTNMDAATDWVMSDGHMTLDFDGSNDYVISATNFLTLADNFAASAWVNVRSIPATSAIFGTANGIPSDVNWALSLTTTGNVRFPYYFQGPQAAITYNTWMHVIGIRQSGTAILFINGVEVGTRFNDFRPTVASQVVFGRYYADFNGFYANMQLADCMIWNRPLSDSDARRLYLLGRGGMYERRRRRRNYALKAARNRTYLFLNRPQIIGGGTL